MAVALSSNELERTIEVLSSAGQTLQLTRFERLSYRALLLSVDAVLATFILVSLIGSFMSEQDAGTWLGILYKIVDQINNLFCLAGLVALAFNMPLLRKTFNEARRFKQLGLNSLSKSLWKESRRNQWISRLRGLLLVVFGFIISLIVIMVLAGAAMMGEIDREQQIVINELGLVCTILALLLFATRYLRNQRERMDLAASAGELRKALVSLRQRKGLDVVSVPAKLLEQTALIESAQIRSERTDAVLQSAAFRPNAYAIAFSREAAGERATLSVEDRVELEDLVAELSTRGEPLESQAQPVPGTEGVTLLGVTKSKRVEIEYVIEHASRSIRITAVRRGEQTAQDSLNGADHG
jgi:hypothetical protein